MSEKIVFSIRDDVTTVDAAAKSRAHFFEICPSSLLSTTARVIYVDCDVLCFSPFDPVFCLLDDTAGGDKLLAVAEGSIVDKNYGDYYGAPLFGPDRLRHLFKERKQLPGFSSGIMLFRNSDAARRLFSFVLEKMEKHKYYPPMRMFDQGFFVFAAYTLGMEHLAPLTQYLSGTNAPLVHFAGDPGQSEKKLPSMIVRLRGHKGQSIDDALEAARVVFAKSFYEPLRALGAEGALSHHSLSGFFYQPAYKHAMFNLGHVVLNRNVANIFAANNQSLHSLTAILFFLMVNYRCKVYYYEDRTTETAVFRAGIDFLQKEYGDRLLPLSLVGPAPRMDIVHFARPSTPPEVVPFFSERLLPSMCRHLSFFDRGTVLCSDAATHPENVAWGEFKTANINDPECAVSLAQLDIPLEKNDIFFSGEQEICFLTDTATVGGSAPHSPRRG